MLNEEKIRIMTRAAIYEKGKGKEDLKVTAYGDSDYVRFNLLKTLIGATVAFLFIVGLYVAYNMDYFMANMMKLDMMKVGREFLLLTSFLWEFMRLSALSYIRQNIRWRSVV